ncbi:DUF6251 family protein [Streptomyces sp. NPDC047971]|uniref:DUF6251 family protein n=1 Tax=Streptomyces sp. NPDC047971 TaxID=3154499 RepID=UPI0033E9327C
MVHQHIHQAPPDRTIHRIALTIQRIALGSWGGSQTRPPGCGRCTSTCRTPW